MGVFEKESAPPRAAPSLTPWQILDQLGRIALVEVWFEFRLFQSTRSSTPTTRRPEKQESLRTKNPVEVARMPAAKNEAHQHPQLNFQPARTYLLGSDPQVGTRTWEQVMTEAARLKQGETRSRWERDVRQKPFDLIRDRLLLDPVLSTSSGFLPVARWRRTRFCVGCTIWPSI